MTINWNAIEHHSRLLIDAELQPAQGKRFQPTGFPDLGAAVYTAPSADGDRTEMVLIESAQSMANRLEAVCWDESAEELRAVLTGMPYVRVDLWDSGQATNSVLEAHRLNSPYIMNDDDFKERFRAEAGVPARRRGSSSGGDASEEGGGSGILDRRTLANAAFKFDPGSVLHGVFLEKLDGRARLQRCVSAFIEATNVQIVSSGGVKNDRVAQDPRSLGFPQGQGAREGFGNVPFHRTEYAAEKITAYFSVDLAQIRAYGLHQSGERFLVTLALWKIRRFLEEGLRLRTACDLEPVGGLVSKRPEGFTVPEVSELESELSGLISACAGEGLFADPPITRLTFQRRKT